MFIICIQIIVKLNIPSGISCFFNDADNHNDQSSGMKYSLTAESTLQLRSPLFGDVSKRTLVVSYRRFGQHNLEDRTDIPEE
jgi:hypothetical protein